MTDEPVIKKIIRDVVREEITPVISQQLMSFEEKILQYFAEFRSNMLNLADKISGEVEDFREENTILELKGQHQRLIDAEEEIENLKNIHPKNQHLFATK